MPRFPLFKTQGEFEAALMQINDFVTAKKENPKKARPGPPFQHAVALLEASWEPLRRLHPVFVWPHLIDSGQEPSRWQWTKTVTALRQAGFEQKRRGQCEWQNDMHWYEIPAYIWEPYLKTHPTSDAISKVTSRTTDHVGSNMDLVIRDACRVYWWAYQEGLVNGPDPHLADENDPEEE